MFRGEIDRCKYLFLSGSRYDIAEKIAKEHNVSVILLCDMNYVLSSDYSEVIAVGILVLFLNIAVGILKIIYLP